MIVISLIKISCSNGSTIKPRCTFFFISFRHRSKFVTHKPGKGIETCCKRPAKTDVWWKKVFPRIRNFVVFLVFEEIGDGYIDFVRLQIQVLNLNLKIS